MKGNAGECQGNVREWRQSARGTQVNAGEYKEMPGERMGVGAKCQGNAGNAGDAKGTYGSGCKMPGECRECRGMTGTYGSWCIVPGECRGLPGECKGVGVKC